eukprot:3940745-Rhodomonas_salina.4
MHAMPVTARLSTYAITGTDTAYLPVQCSVLTKAIADLRGMRRLVLRVRMLLCTSYAIPSTDVAYHAPADHSRSTLHGTSALLCSYAHATTMPNTKNMPCSSHYQMPATNILH